MDVATGIGLGINAVAVLASLIASLRNGDKIREVHLSLNSRLDQLLDAKGRASFAEGAASVGPTDPLPIIVLSAKPEPKK